MMAGNGFNFLYGGAGADTIVGGTGEKGENHLYGGDGDDEIWGHGVNDLLLGGAGKDKLVAGNNGAFLEGGTGDDQLFGGRGPDTFSFFVFPGETWGNDVINGFQHGKDHLDFAGLDLTYNSLKSNITYIGGNTLLQYGTSSITLVSVKSVVESDFIFAH